MIGQNILSLRMRNGLTQEELAANLGVAHQRVEDVAAMLEGYGCAVSERISD